MTFDYGLKEEDPVKKTIFYSKQELDTPKTSSTADLSLLLPDTYQEELVYFYCKNSNKYEIALRLMALSTYNRASHILI